MKKPTTTSSNATASDSPCVARLTPPGRGAVATLVISGNGAADLADHFFHAHSRRRLTQQPSSEIAVGRFGEEQKTGEQVVARRVSENQIFLHCHGGTAAVARIESLLAAEGAVVTDWRSWANAAHDDLLQAEALIALAEATTEPAAAVLLDQCQGALRAGLRKIKTDLDAGHTGAATEQIDRLLARASFGLHLTKPWKVVLAGPVNAGKSSLVNTLVGYGRAIVHATPGTTRDVLTAGTSIGGWPVELIDTAGLREADHSIEAEGVRRAREALNGADLVLLVFDSSRPFTRQDGVLLEEIAGEKSTSTAGQPVLVIHNKSDLTPCPTDRPEGFSASALTGDHMDELLRTIAARLVPNPPPPGEAIPWTQRQIKLLEKTQTALGNGNPTLAVTLLGEIEHRSQ